MVLFTAGNILARQAPDYTTLVIARLLTGLAHGVFFSIGSTIATSPVPKESGIRHCDHVRWVDRCTRYGRTVGHVYRTTLRLA